MYHLNFQRPTIIFNIMIGCMLSLLYSNQAFARFYIMHDAPAEVVSHKPINKGVNKQKKTTVSKPDNYGKTKHNTVLANPCQPKYTHKKNDKPIIAKTPAMVHVPFFVKYDKIKNVKKKEKGITGFGTRVSLVFLAKQVMPKGWLFNCEYKPCNIKEITWRATTPTPWKDVLNGGLKALNQPDLSLNINNKTKIITVNLKYDAQKSRVWHIYENDTLKGVIKRITTNSGFRFSWSQPLSKDDWNIGLSQNIEGSMEEVIQNLVTAFNKKGVLIDVNFNHKLKLVEVTRMKSTLYMSKKRKGDQ